MAHAGAARAAAALSRRACLQVPAEPVPVGPGRRRYTTLRATGTEIAIRTGCSVRAGELLARDGRLFEGALLDTGDALARGEIDPDKARRFADRLGECPLPTALEVQAAVLPGAGLRSPAQLDRDLTRALIEVDPAEAEDRHRRARTTRRVHHPRVLPDGMAGIWAVLPADQAARVDATLDAAATSARAAGDPRTLDQLRADGLVDLVAGAPGQGGHTAARATPRRGRRARRRPGVAEHAARLGRRARRARRLRRDHRRAGARTRGRGHLAPDRHRSTHRRRPGRRADPLPPAGPASGPRRRARPHLRQTRLRRARASRRARPHGPVRPCCDERFTTGRAILRAESPRTTTSRRCAPPITPRRRWVCCTSSSRHPGFSSGPRQPACGCGWSPAAAGRRPSCRGSGASVRPRTRRRSERRVPGCRSHGSRAARERRPTARERQSTARRREGLRSAERVVRVHRTRRDDLDGRQVLGRQRRSAAMPRGSARTAVISASCCIVRPMSSRPSISRQRV